ncbi:MAG: hypothetical protein MJ094_04645 [Saccharofermentans sp.]|nr:hypothetical protein [Saccharofermentans sp.]
MNARNYSVVVVILLLVAAIIGFLAFKVNSMSDGIKAAYEEKTTQELADQLAENDYRIYLIGEMPEYLNIISDHITVLTVGQVNSVSMPVNEGNSSMTVFDQDGNVISEREQRDYADFMLIIINTDEEITTDKMDIIRNCAVENHVPVLLVGANSINTFREYMIMIPRDCSAASSMLFEVSRDVVDNPIDMDIVASGGREYANALMEFMLLRIENPVVVYVSPDTLPTAVETQETEFIEETEITEEILDAA